MIRSTPKGAGPRLVTALAVLALAACGAAKPSSIDVSTAPIASSPARGGCGADAGIRVADSPDTRVSSNTVTIAGTHPNAIGYRFRRTTGVVITVNTVDAATVARDGATGTVSGNTQR